jgi:hypothetical protein
MIDLIPAPYRWAAVALVAALLFASGSWAGFALRSNMAEAEEGRRQTAEAVAFRKSADAMNTAAANVAGAIARARDQVRVVTVETQKETERVEYRCPVPQSGVDLYNRAARGLRDEPAR